MVRAVLWRFRMYSYSLLSLNVACCEGEMVDSRSAMCFKGNFVTYTPPANEIHG